MNNCLDVDTRKQLQTLARHQLIKKVLADIAADMQVCKLEGWNIYELPIMLKNEIDNILENKINK